MAVGRDNRTDKIVLIGRYIGCGQINGLSVVGSNVRNRGGDCFLCPYNGIIDKIQGHSVFFHEQKRKMMLFESGNQSPDGILREREITQELLVRIKAEMPV